MPTPDLPVGPSDHERLGADSGDKRGEGEQLERDMDELRREQKLRQVEEEENPGSDPLNSPASI